ncbi:hypothetical protein AXG93_2550s1110 [Marchantia polymorpha subsp. ruderalis]|uniref:Uncharacterized protein n=1 Tax=Marchantia polymorpha subsp. ruderalis TaxID=1480154 RepID=A0A176VLH1_MARPO|nr:hypothetical protein AXG93_2550s1110 [Marchantia polymorpha subsp. ruderalis]
MSAAKGDGDGDKSWPPDEREHRQIPAKGRRRWSTGGGGGGGVMEGGVREGSSSSGCLFRRRRVVWRLDLGVGDDGEGLRGRRENDGVRLGAVGKQRLRSCREGGRAGGRLWGNESGRKKFRTFLGKKNLLGHEEGRGKGEKIIASLELESRARMSDG